MASSQPSTSELQIPSTSTARSQSSSSASPSSSSAASMSPTTAAASRIATMKRLRISAMPPILYGTAWKGEQTDQLVLQALSSGFRGIDTAGQRKHYREDLVGQGILRARAEGIIQCRSQIWVQTKFTPISGQDSSGLIPYDPSDRAERQVRESFKHSLRNIHPGWEPSAEEVKSLEGAGAEADGRGGDEKEPTAYIDSYLLHSPLSTLEETVEAWKVLEGLVQRRWVRRIGFSNVYDPRILQVLASASTSSRTKPTILQNRWHHSTGHDVSLLSLLSPILSPNDYPLSSDPSEPRPEGVTYQPFWTLTGNPRLLTSTPVLDAAAKKLWSEQMVLYRFVRQGFGLPGLRGVVLCGSTQEKHMREAVKATADEEEDLEDETVEAIRKIIYGE